LNYFGARYYDSDLGRWTSVDPLADKYPGWSPYNYTLNNPIKYIDPDGNEIAISIGSRKDGTVSYATYRDGKLYQGNREYSGNNKFALSVKNTLNNIISLNDERTSEIISRLSSQSGRFHLITETSGGSGVGSNDPYASNLGKKTGSRIRFNLISDTIENGLQTTSESSLSHELEHANDFDEGKRAGYYEVEEIPGHKDPVEIRAVNTENGIRLKQGLKKRTSYGNKEIDPKLLD
jgi:uncharacterized protein RhaS with RHS repeats